MVSPPKPPRAHDWKLLVKNIRVTLNQEENAAGWTLVSKFTQILMKQLQLVCLLCPELINLVGKWSAHTYITVITLVNCNQFKETQTFGSSVNKLCCHKLAATLKSKDTVQTSLYLQV